MVKAAIYARVSSTANKDGAGISRQTTVCKQKCKEANTQIACQVAEVISGSLPLQQRNVFNNLLKKCHEGQITKVFVEGSRAFARNAFVAEAMYEKSKELGVQIVPVDLPDLCAHQPNPAQKFLRRVMFAYTELEKDMTVTRLQHGWKQKIVNRKEETTGWPEGAPQSEWPGQNQWPEGQLGSKPELQTAQEFAQGMQDVQAGQVDSAHDG